MHAQGYISNLRSYDDGLFPLGRGSDGYGRR